MKDLITEGYRDQNKMLHNQSNFGNSGKRWAPFIFEQIRRFKIQTVLDYGCGKGELFKMLLKEDPDRYLGLRRWVNYDPAVPLFEKLEITDPELVICTDVLEHVEPEYLDETIKRIFKLAQRYVFINVPARQGKRRLPDGTPAHKTVQSKAWWKGKLIGLASQESKASVYNLPEIKEAAKWDLNIFFSMRKGGQK